MIKSKKDLKEYIEADRKRNPSTFNPLLRILGLNTEAYMVRKLLYNLRMYEYYLNIRPSWFNKLSKKYYGWRYNRISFKMRIIIAPNTIGKGLHIAHWTEGIIVNCISMGEYCGITSGVIVGNKDNQTNRAIIGNNVHLIIGCKVIGKINIGNNVLIAPNAVVVKDVQDNTIVGGIPAKVIKQFIN